MAAELLSPKISDIFVGTAFVSFVLIGALILTTCIKEGDVDIVVDSSHELET